MVVPEERRKNPCQSCYWHGMKDEDVKKEISRNTKQGVMAAFEELGFYDVNGKVDRNVVGDFAEARTMLKNWREFKKETWTTIRRWILYVALGLLAVKLDIIDYLRAGKQ